MKKKTLHKHRLIVIIQSTYYEIILFKKHVRQMTKYQWSITHKFLEDAFGTLSLFGQKNQRYNRKLFKRYREKETSMLSYTKNDHKHLISISNSRIYCCWCLSLWSYTIKMKALNLISEIVFFYLQLKMVLDLHLLQSLHHDNHHCCLDQNQNLSKKIANNQTNTITQKYQTNSQ